MIYPDSDDVLASITDTFDRYIAPHVRDEYAASLCLTVSQLLRSVRARIAHEGAALHEDNAELRALLHRLQPHVPPDVGARAARAVSADAGEPGGYVSVARLQEQAVELRAALVACIAALPDPAHPGRALARTYLEHQLRRQQPWLIDAFDGPRR